MPSTVDRKVRRERGKAIAATCKITEKNGFYLVPSQTGNGFHRVKLDPLPFVPGCSCKDYEANQEDCKHVWAVRYHLGRSQSAPTSPCLTARPATLLKRTCAKRPNYPQNWPAYDAAQIHEKEKFLDLLRDLCRGIPEPPPRPGRGKGGRPPVPMADRAFAAALKVYTTISGRRASTDLRTARDNGHVSRAPHFTTVSRSLEDEAMTPILTGLIAESARPLQSVETRFAVDSSGFTTSRFVRWHDAKYGRPMHEYDWVKCHIVTGVKTNVVTAVVIGERYSGDCVQFIPLLNATAASGFKIGEVSADSAYSSYDNNDRVGELGGTPYIDFKASATGRDGGMFAKMFHLYCYNRDEFKAHYHKRSNVETTFSMVKLKFGDSIRSKTDTAMANEALCKILCHNICVLIQSAYELGIAAKFWGEAAKEREEVARAEKGAMEDVEWLAWV